MAGLYAGLACGEGMRGMAGCRSARWQRIRRVKWAHKVLQAFKANLAGYGVIWLTAVRLTGLGAQVLLAVGASRVGGDGAGWPKPYAGCWQSAGRLVAHGMEAG